MPISEVYNTDCMEYMKSIPDKFFDLAIVDPPYFDGPDKLGYYGKDISSFGVRRSGYKAKHWDLPDISYFKELFRVSKHQIVWGVNYYPYACFTPGRIIWNKENGKSSFSDCEIAFCSNIDSVRMFTHLGSGSSRIAAYKMGFDFWGTEIDEEYFNMQEKRFREECLGEVRLKNGNVYKQKELFEL